MILVLALAVIGQYLDDATVTHQAAAALLHHPLQLAPESRELGDTPVDFRQVMARNAVGSVA